jgi:uncharacterized membrane protein
MSKTKTTDFMTHDEFDRVAETVREAERKTSGEIRVIIVSDFEKGVKTAREQAIHEFYRNGMDKTRDKTGVLILLVLERRAVEVLADQGINEKVESGTWDKVVSAVSQGIKQGRRCEAVCNAVREVGDTLALYFPRREDDTDELPDTVIVRG